MLKKDLPMGEKITEDIIRSKDGGLWLRAPRKPFPWWGSFHPVNSIGRILLLVSLWFLALLFSIIVAALESWNRPGTSELMVAFLILLIPLVTSFTAGSGILMRKTWGIGSLRILLTVLSIFIWLGITIMFGSLLNEAFDERYYYYRSLDSEFFFPLILLVLSFFGIIIPLWGYFRAPHVRYEFDFVPLSRIDRNVGKSAIRFAFSFLVAGIFQVSIILFTVMEEPRFFRILGGNWIIKVYPVAVLVAGLLIIIFAPAFAWKSNAGRMGLLVLCWVQIILMIVLLVSFLYDAVSFQRLLSPSSIGNPELVFLILIIFGIAIASFVFFEIRRYLSSDRAKAWCWKVVYIPPWRKQIKVADLQPVADTPRPKPESYSEKNVESGDK